MTDELERLARTRAPAPSAEGRARALAAAIKAFDANTAYAISTQGKQRGWRQSSIINRIWSPVMNRKYRAGSALAALLILPAAGFLTLELTRDTLSLSKPESEVSRGALPKGTETAAEAATEAPVTPAVDQEAAATVQEPDLSDVQPERLADIGTVAPERQAARHDMPSADAAAPLGTLSRSGRFTTMAQEAMPAPAIMRDESLFTQPEGRDRFSGEEPGSVKSVATDPVSTFSADVDTASYAFVRKTLMAGQLPDRDSVRVEEMVNYFPYDWPGPDTKDAPFKATVTLLPTPWNAGTRLMHIGIRGYDVAPAAAAPANLVFLIDVSGSMDEPDKLPLLKSAFRLMVDALKPDDTVAIVTYAGNAGTVLTPTKVSGKSRILSAIDTLQPGGATAGAQGIEAAYALARQAFVKDGVNRVILATDGDFNVGPSSDGDLKAMIAAKRDGGIFLSVLGFGRGNYNDALMQTLAQNGNGTAAYIDTLAEARKTLVEEAGASLFPIARDVKFQVEFNPAQIAEYRLIGYETRALKREDFNNDRVDAGDIGSGHRVTALYEVTPKGSAAVLVDDLRYEAENPAQPIEASPSAELAFLKLRYKLPGSDTSTLITMPVTPSASVARLQDASADIRFSVAVVAFAQKLRGTGTVSAYPYAAILDLAANARGADVYGYRAEFLNLVRLASGLSAP